jgi:hypothetical protein
MPVVHHSKIGCRLAASGHARRFGHVRGMSACPATPATSLHRGNDAMVQQPTKFEPAINLKAAKNSAFLPAETNPARS